MYRWMLPGFSLAIIGALVFAALHYGLWSWSLGTSVYETEWKPVANSDVLMWFLGGAALLTFLLSRYAVGMARQPEWAMLRAGAAYLTGVTLGAVALAGTFGAIHFLDSPTPEHILAQVLRILMLVLAAETALNLILDFYRPRAMDEEPRPSFDSRLLGLFTEPGGIARSIADAINYQFGFEVSSTWFYQLLEKSAVPLLGFAAVSLLLASSVVFVQAQERGVVERFGKPVATNLEPGIHLKWPWPVSRFYTVGTERVHELTIGLKQQTEEERARGADELILWTNQHAQEPHLLVLVATPKLAEFMQETGPGEDTDADAEEILQPFSGPQLPEQNPLAETSEAVSVSQLRVSLSIQYRIREAYPWLTTYQNPDLLFEAIANREVIRYFASADVTGVLGTNRGPIEAALWETIQSAVDNADLGVDLVFLGMQGVHPPTDAAESFQDVIGAEQKKTAAIRTARAEYNKQLSKIAGDVRRAEQLAALIRKVNRLEADKDATVQDKTHAQDRLEQLFFGHQEKGIRPVGGEASSTIAKARSERWRLENEAHGQAVAFVQEKTLKDIAPSVYQVRQYLTTLAESARGVRKFVIAAERDGSTPVFHLDIKDPMNAPMDVALEPEFP